MCQPNSSVRTTSPFTDGDTLIANLPTEVDLEALDSILLKLEHNQSSHIQTLLIDCMLAKRMAGGVDSTFVQIGRVAATRKINILLLDPDPKIGQRLQSLIPVSEVLHSSEYGDSFLDIY